MDLDTVTDELYALPREEFTSVRDERARQARAEGDRELAGRIGRLRKPSTAAWLANLLARERPDEVGGLVDLGDALRRAHSELDGEALRRLSGQRHELVAALAGQARELGRAAGHQVSDSVSRELEDTFTAALGDPDAARTLATGRLSTALQPGAGDGWGWPTGGAEQGSGQRGDRAARRDREHPGRRESTRQRERGTQTKRRDDQQREQRDRLQRDLDAARRAASEAQGPVRAAAEALRRAERAKSEADALVTDRRAELEAAERAAAGAAEDTAAARRAHETAEARAREAQRRADDLYEQLERVR